MYPYTAHVSADGSVSLTAGAMNIKVAQEVKQVELTQEQYLDLVTKSETQDIKFDTVKQRLTTTPRETEPLSGDQSN